MSEVSFCSLLIEIQNSSPNLSIKYSSGRALDDILENINYMASSNSVLEPEEMEKRIKGRRGNRRLSDIVVTTIVSSPTELSSSPETPSSENTISFISGNSFVEVTKGLLHIFKENNTTSLEEGVIRSQMICMLSVPAKIKTPELLQFTAPCHSELELIRIIHDGSPNEYMVLFRFMSQEAADVFYQTFNGKPFNSFESDISSLVYVSKIESVKESEYEGLKGHTELPLCSICLERMDESVSTVLTILCNHSFHGSCLALWEDSSCPVCRYVQTPEVVAEQRCSECLSPDDLWICLICGYVGCGRYVGGHSHAHFVETQHLYTMELGSNRVWDYVGDNFVHRLVQTDSADRKIVEASSNESSKSGLDGLSVNSDEKMDSLQLEYTYLLTSQLESQRRYYEEKLNRVIETSSREINEIHNRAKDSVEEKDSLQHKLNALLKEKQRIEQKFSQTNLKYNKLHTELKEEKEINDSLRQNQNIWQQKIKTLEDKMTELTLTKESEIKDLQEQIHDLMFFMSARDTVAQSPEIQDGAISLPTVEIPKENKVGGRTRKRGKK